MSKGKKGFQPGNRCGINTRFSRDQQPKRKGRKPSLYKHLNLPGEELSKEDFTNIMLSLLECSTGQLVKIREDCKHPDSKIPVWIDNMIAAIFNDIRKGRLNCLRWVLDRSFGKPEYNMNRNTQIQIIKNDLKIFNFSALSDTELVLFHSLCLKMEGKVTRIEPVDPEKL